MMNNPTTAPADTEMPALRSGDLRERNRRVGTVVACAVVLLMLLSMAYIYWFGGINKGPMKPLGDVSPSGLLQEWGGSLTA